MKNLRADYLRDTEEFLAIALASEKMLPARGTSRTLPAAQARRAKPEARKAGGQWKRALRAMFGGDL